MGQEIYLTKNKNFFLEGAKDSEILWFGTRSNGSEVLNELPYINIGFSETPKKNGKTNYFELKNKVKVATFPILQIILPNNVLIQNGTIFYEGEIFIISGKDEIILSDDTVISKEYIILKDGSEINLENYKISYPDGENVTLDGLIFKNDGSIDFPNGYKLTKDKKVFDENNKEITPNKDSFYSSRIYIDDNYYIFNKELWDCQNNKYNEQGEIINKKEKYISKKDLDNFKNYLKLEYLRKTTGIKNKILDPENINVNLIWELIEMDINEEIVKDIFDGFTYFDEEFGEKIIIEEEIFDYLKLCDCFQEIKKCIDKEEKVYLFVG